MRMREQSLAIQAGHAYQSVMRARTNCSEAARELREADAAYRLFGRPDREGIELHHAFEAYRWAGWR